MIILWVNSKMWYMCDSIQEALNKVKEYKLKDERWHILTPYISHDDDPDLFHKE